MIGNKRPEFLRPPHNGGNYRNRARAQGAKRMGFPQIVNVTRKLLFQEWMSAFYTMGCPDACTRGTLSPCSTSAPTAPQRM